MDYNDEMRLSDTEINLLLTVIHTVDKTAEVRLFGSRVDDAKQGGDIDIIILSSYPERFTRQALRLIRQHFFDKFGEQKIDLVIDTPEPTDPFTKKVVPHSIKLNHS